MYYIGSRGSLRPRGDALPTRRIQQPPKSQPRPPNSLPFSPLPPKQPPDRDTNPLNRVNFKESAKGNAQLQLWLPHEEVVTLDHNHDCILLHSKVEYFSSEEKIKLK